MVDTGAGQPESVIDLTTRRRRTDGEGRGAARVDWEGDPGGDLLSLPFLVRRLSARSNQVRMWGAFQLVDRWHEDCARFMDELWEAPQEEIRESAITLIGKYGLQDYAFPLMREFASGEHTLRYAAGVALGRLRYQSVERMLKRWFSDLAANPEATPMELEAAAESLLFYDNAAYWEVVVAQLESFAQNHSLYSTLFSQLVAHAETPAQIGRLARAYGEVREVFNDFHLTQHLVERVGRANLSRYFQARLSGGYPLTAIYQDCLKVMGWEVSDWETRALLDELAACRNSREGMVRFLPLARNLLERLHPEPAAYAHVLAFLEGCRAWAGQWDSAILKVREQEYLLLVSLPIATLLERVEALCLADPEREALRITRLYQSPLLSPPFMGKVLNLIGHNARRNGMAELGATTYAGWVRDEEKDALWRLYTNQLAGVDYPLEQVLAQPWEYPLPDLMDRLVGVLEHRIGSYLVSGRSQAVDYALEVFRRRGTSTMVTRLLPHFDLLINRHFHGFVDLMTHLPDVRFLQPLVNHYRAGESDLLRLIHFICDVHGRPYPRLEVTEEEDGPASASTGRVRLLCRACGGAYEYVPEQVFVDEERIEQRQIPSARDVWTPTSFACKKCGSPVPFDPDERFLNDLFAELLAARLFPPPGGQEASLGNIRLVQFPRLAGRTYNPAHFFKEAERLLGAADTSAQETPHLLELGRFQIEIGAVGEAKQTFLRIVAGPSKCPEALYYLGVIAFQEKNLYEARVYFSRLIQSCAREDFENELDNPVDMAHHYLKLLEKREFKRSHFHLISS